MLPEPYFDDGQKPTTTGKMKYNGGVQSSAPGDVGASRGLTWKVVAPMPHQDTPPQDTGATPKRPGPRKGYKQSPSHIAKRIRRGEDHHAWKGDAIAERSGRSRALRAFPEIGPCVDCGSDKAERHHQDHNTANNEPSNIVALCRSCHVKRHHAVGGDYRAAALANLEKAKEARWADREDTAYRPGDACPACGHRLGVVATRRRYGCRFTYVGCRKERGGCGASYGSVKEPTP